MWRLHLLLRRRPSDLGCMWQEDGVGGVEVGRCGRHVEDRPSEVRGQAFGTTMASSATHGDEKMEISKSNSSSSRG
jgi:hypothetical protein